MPFHPMLCFPIARQNGFVGRTLVGGVLSALGVPCGTPGGANTLTASAEDQPFHKCFPSAVGEVRTYIAGTNCSTYPETCKSSSM